MKTLLLILAITFSAFGQTNKLPSAKYSGKKPVSLSDMLGDGGGFKCKKSKTYSGIVVKRNFDENETIITSFTLKDANDERIHLNLNEKQSWLLGKTAPVVISTILRKGKKVTVSSYSCTGGGSGVFRFADKIK